MGLGLAQCVGKSGAQIVWSSGGAVSLLQASSNTRLFFSLEAPPLFVFVG